MPRSSPPPPPPSSRPGRPKRPKPERHRRDAALDAGAIDAALVGVVPDARDRAFVLRCILSEGPRHHRVASWALLRLLAEILAELGGADPRTLERASEPLDMRLPPSVAASSDDAEFPIGVPTPMLRAVMDRAEADLALECLREGPAHHALANAAMAWLLQAIYDRVRGDRG